MIRVNYSLALDIQNPLQQTKARPKVLCSRVVLLASVAPSTTISGQLRPGESQSYLWVEKKRALCCFHRMACPLRCLREQMIHHSTSPTIRGVTRTCSKTVPFNCAIAHHRCRHPREPQRNGCGRGRPVGVCGMAARQRPPTANRPPERDIFCCSHRSARCAHADWECGCEDHRATPRGISP